MSTSGILAAGPVAPASGAARPLSAPLQPAPEGVGTPVTAPAVRRDFAEPICDVEIPLQRAWRMAEALAAIGGGPRAEWLIELANRPGPVRPGSLLEAIKRLGIAPSASAGSRAG